MPKRAIAVTFDDGYADNLNNAKEILRSYDVPATIFLTTGNIDGDREFWWDEVERVCFETESLPPNLSLRINGEENSWSVDQESLHEIDSSENSRTWNVLSEETPTARHRLYKSLMYVLRPLTHEAQSAALDEIVRWAGSVRRVRETHRTLSEDEVRRLAAGGLVDLGAHTVNHDRLSAIPLSAQKRTIEESKVRIEAILKGALTAFSYPYGSSDDFTDSTKALVKEAGFSLACTTIQTVVNSGSDLYELPRFLVRDWSGAEFAEQLKKWQGN